MLRSTLHAALAGVAFVALAAPVAAQRITSPYAFVEESQAARVYVSQLYTDRGIIDLGPGSGMSVGLGYTLRVTGPFNVDGRVTYFPTSRNVFDVTEPPPDSATLNNDPKAGLENIGTADLGLLLMDAALRFDITGPRTFFRLQPYALIGAGYGFAVSSDDSVEVDLPTDIELRYRFGQGFTGQVGAGIEWHMSNRLTLQLDARDILWQVQVPSGFREQGRLIDSEEWVQNAHLSLAASFRF